VLLTPVPALAQERRARDASPPRGFAGVYVGAVGGYDVQPNDSTARLDFDRNLDGQFSDTVLTGTGADAFAPAFRGGRAQAAQGPRNYNDYRVRAAGAPGTPFTNTANGGTIAGNDFRRSDDTFRWHSLRATAAFRL